MSYEKNLENTLYLNLEGIRDAFAKHLMKYRDYSEKEAAFAVSDFPDPYKLPYLYEEYVDNVIIDGVAYEQYADAVNLLICGITGVPVFRFYTYYALDDVPNNTVGEYISARKLYRIEDLSEEDVSF